MEARAAIPVQVEPAAPSRLGPASVRLAVVGLLATGLAACASDRGACVHPQHAASDVMECMDGVNLALCGQGRTHTFHAGKRCPDVGYTMVYGANQYTRPQLGSCLLDGQCLPDVERVACANRGGRFQSDGGCPPASP